ncbi:MAG: hypothetical protein J3Q66DRAFT_127970 [Benniella sp.]|nr:MAG: hypothetical protein J3Q66DRAFT_127970 [Benniella sp.]
MSRPHRRMLVLHNAKDLAHHQGRARLRKKDRFLFMTYNLLAQALVRRDMFPYASQKALRWKFRKQNLLQEFLEYKPDLACLQEVDFWDEVYHPALTKAGYDTVYYKNLNKKHGCAIIWRHSRFEKVDQLTLEYDDIGQPTFRTGNIGLMVALRPVQRKPEHENPDPNADMLLPEDNDDNNEHGEASTYADGEAAADGEAEDDAKGDTPGGILVATTHLFWRPDGSYERLRQASILLEKINEWNQQLKYTVLLGGDFNTTPRDAAYRAMTRNQMPPQQIPNLEQWLVDEVTRVQQAEAEAEAQAVAEAASASAASASVTSASASEAPNGEQTNRDLEQLADQTQLLDLGDIPKDAKKAKTKDTNGAANAETASGSSGSSGSSTPKDSNGSTDALNDTTEASNGATEASKGTAKAKEGNAKDKTSDLPYRAPPTGIILPKKANAKVTSRSPGSSGSSTPEDSNGTKEGNGKDKDPDLPYRAPPTGIILPKKANAKVTSRSSTTDGSKGATKKANAKATSGSSTTEDTGDTKETGPTIVDAAGYATSEDPKLKRLATALGESGGEDTPIVAPLEAFTPPRQLLATIESFARCISIYGQYEALTKDSPAEVNEAAAAKTAAETSTATPAHVHSTHGEPTFTNFATWFKDTLDYVYLRDEPIPENGARLVPLRLLEIPDKSHLGHGLPDENFSSDHLCLVVDFAILARP